MERQHKPSGGNARSWGAPVFLGAMALWPAAASAGLEWHPYAASQYEYNSNVFSLSSRQQAVDLNGDPNRADSLWRNVVGLDTDYSWDRDHAGFTVEGRRLLYDRFTQLNHNEYLLSANAGWKLGSAWDGSVEASEERRLASYADRITTQREMERDRNAVAHINVNLSPEWRLETGAASHRLDSPLPDFPGFRLDENSGSAAIKYLGVERLAAGLQATYGAGRFSGTPEALSYNQVTEVFTASYNVSGLSMLDGNIGFTRFSSNGSQGGKVDGLSGMLQYTRHISVKTDVHAQVFRRTAGYTAGADAEIDSGLEAGASWQATGKIAVAADYDWTYSEFRALSAVAAVGSDRRDHYQQSTLELRYAALDWLLLRVYGAYFNRSSNLPINSFNQALAGIELRARLP